MGRRSVLMTACVLAATVLAGQPAGAAAGSGYLNPWALQSEDKGANQAPVPHERALADAKNFNVLIAHVIAYKDSLAEMRAANPNLKVYAYMNGTFAQSFEPPPTYPDSSYARNIDGDYAIKYGNHLYMMNPRDPTWIESRVQVCETKLRDSGYDGCFLDLLGVAPVNGTFIKPAPVNPATRQPWTQADWLAATTDLGSIVRERVHADFPGKIVFGNGASTGPLFFQGNAPTKLIVDKLDGGLSEAWLRGSKAPVTKFLSEEHWKKSVDMIVYTEQQSKPMFVMTKMWVPATQAQKDRWRYYTMASFLLGTGGRSAWSYSDDPRAPHTQPLPDVNTALGNPTGPYAKVGGVYQRSFATGRVLVNPTAANVTVGLGRTYYTLDRRPVTSVTVASNTGLVLTTS